MVPAGDIAAGVRKGQWGHTRRTKVKRPSRRRASLKRVMAGGTASVNSAGKSPAAPKKGWSRLDPFPARGINGANRITNFTKRTSYCIILKNVLWKITLANQTKANPLWSQNSHEPHRDVSGGPSWSAAHRVATAPGGGEYIWGRARRPPRSASERPLTSPGGINRG